MDYKYIFLLVFVLSLAVAADEKYIFELDVDSFDSYIESHSDVIIKMYTPWCTYCQRFEPIYQSVAEEIHTIYPNVKAAQIDVASNPRIGRRLNIKGFPVLYYFKNGKPYHYNDSMKQEKIIDFVKQFAEVSDKNADSVDLERRVNRVKEMLALRDFCILGFFEKEDDPRVKELDQALYMVEHISRIVLTEKDVAEKMGVTIPSIVLYEGVNKHYIYKGEMIQSELRKWILVHKLPLIVPYSSKNAKLVFNAENGVNLQMLFFTFSAPSSWAMKVTAMVESVAERYRGKIIVIGMSADNSRLLNYYGVRKAEVPAILLTEKKDGISRKYRLATFRSEEQIAEFVEQGLKGQLTPYLRSEPEPPPSLSPVKKLVGTSINSVLRSSTQHVIVFFYTEFDNNSSDFEPVFQAVAESMRNDNSVMFASFNTMENEVEWFTYKEFPIVLAFKPGMIENWVKYEGMWEEAPFREFVEQQLQKEGGEEEL